MSVGLILFRMILAVVEQLPCWATYLLLLVLSMGAWYLVGLAFVSIAGSMM